MNAASTLIQKVWRGYNTRKIIAVFIQQYTQINPDTYQQSQSDEEE